MNKYVYKDHIKECAIEFKLSSKQHNSIFEHRKKTLFKRFEYYKYDKHIIMEQYNSLLGVIISLLFFPFYLLRYDAKEILLEFKNLLNQKKCGSFSSYYIKYSEDTDSDWYKLKEKSK